MLTLNNPTEAARGMGAEIAMAVLSAGKLKRPPTHPGAVAADILDEQRTSGRKAAAAMGLSVNGLAQVLACKTPVTAETAVRFGAYFGNGPDLWLRMQADYDLWHAAKTMKAEVAKIKPLAAKSA